jgi:hypothetical protein
LFVTSSIHQNPNFHVIQVVKDPQALAPKEVTLVNHPDSIPFFMKETSSDKSPQVAMI